MWRTVGSLQPLIMPAPPAPATNDIALTAPAPEKRKLAAATITKACSAAMNKIIKELEKRSKIEQQQQQQKQQRFLTTQAWDIQLLSPPGVKDTKK